jgi:hypothetical protein
MLSAVKSSISALKSVMIKKIDLLTGPAFIFISLHSTIKFTEEEIKISLGLEMYAAGGEFVEFLL